jgi:peptidyl-prolyl cis-trans isomerase-like 4
MAVVPDSTNKEEGLCGSQFFITCGDNLSYLDGKQAVFGKVVEGFEVLEAINGSIVDEVGRPYKDIR